MIPEEKPLLGQILVEKKIITSQQLETALKRQQETGELLGVALLKLGYMDEESVLVPVLANQLGVDFVRLSDLQIPPDVIAKIPARFANHYKIIPISLQNDVLTIASAHPLAIDVIDGVGLIVQTQIQTVLASERDIQEAIRKYYGVGAETIDRMMDQKPVAVVKETADDISEIDSEASIGKFVNQILLAAYRDRATDIHIEPYEKEIKIRYRVDGILYDTKLPTNIWHFKDSISSRIKILSHLDISERRLPQDGRFTLRMEDVDLDLRVSFLPTQYGESIVIRILTSNKLYHLDELGLLPDNLKLLDELIKKPHGIIFITGPTGSGKTTTLYSCLAHVNQAERKIITIEDPVEYQLKGVTQVQVHPQIGLTFAAGLRSMLRHDPDIMMVGEVRDLETAQIAVQVALTGHLVFSTLHTNDAASGVTRLLDMGVEPYLVCSSVECFVAQRLVRRLCLKCRKKGSLTPQIIKDFDLNPQAVEGVTIYESQGCEACKGMGFLGREAIYEFLEMSEPVKKLVMARASADEIKAKAVSLGFRTLAQDGWDKVCRGVTTPGEIIRVTKEELG